MCLIQDDERHIQHSNSIEPDIMHPALSSSQEQPPTFHYRPSGPLPTQLLDHATVCLEEELFSPAFDLLTSTLTAGSDGTRLALIPPPQYFSLAATIALHPGFTTRTTSQDKLDAGNDASRYLLQAAKVVGPRNADFTTAFKFVPRSTAPLRKKRQPRSARASDITNSSGNSNDDGDEDHQPGRIESQYLTRESLWENADDFWAMVGWAFNCSVAHPPRWERWKLFLTFILDVMESDLEERIQIGGVGKSLLAWYLDPIGEGRNSKRRVMRAVLADGRPKCLAEFKEIWRNETKPPKVPKDVEEVGRKKGKLDLEKGEFGDYFDDSDEESAGHRTSRSTTARASRAQEESEDDSRLRKRRKTPRPSEESTNPMSLGDAVSLHLRQRLLAVLLRYCTTNPQSFLDSEDLFDLYTEFLRPLPLAVFRSLVLPPHRLLDPHEQSSLNQMLLRPLISSSAPEYNANALTQEDFERHFAPFPAHVTNVVDNAKVALLVEDLLMLLWRSGTLERTEGLGKVIREGINARREKVAQGGGRKTGARAVEEEDAANAMRWSGERMLGLLGMLEEG
jgi:hypothetical protein